MSGDKKLILGEDLPKQNPWQHDRLGYASLAERLARTLINTITPNGYVIGLHGRWGSGKSTMLNFVLAHIAKHNEENQEDQIIHIDFRPWLIAGHQDLIVGFFKILTENLTANDPTWKRNKRKIANVFGATSNELIDAAAKIALTLDPSGGFASGAVGKIAKSGISAMLKPFLDDPSVQSAYITLIDRLKNSNKRFLVTIDDIDRLNDDEIKSIMHMVKSVGQLPNITYLLSYDREIVWPALDRGVTRQGPKFGEKIVQHEIELPSLQRRNLLSLLDEEIGFLIADTPNESRWHDIILNGIHRWINTPRDIVRLANGIKFVWPAIKGEVDPQDVLAMEGLKIFDREIFNWVRDNRDFLFSEGIFQMGDEEANDRVIEQLKRRIDDDFIEQVMSLLCVLFPRTKKQLLSKKNTLYTENYDDIMKRRGIGSLVGYDAYFSMTLPSGAISKSTIDAMTSPDCDADLIRRTFEKALTSVDSSGAPQIGVLLDELRIRFRGSKAAHPSPTLFRVLFEFGEEIIAFEGPREAFTLPPRAQLTFMIENMLERLGPEEAAQQIEKAFDETESVAFLAEIYTDLGRNLGVFPSDSLGKQLIGPESFERLGVILLEKITKAVSDKSIEEAPFYFNIMHAWTHLSGLPEVKAWMEDGIKASALFLAKVGVGLVGYSLGTPVRVYSMSEKPDANLYDLEKLHEASETHMNSPSLSNDQCNLIKAIFEGTSRFLNRHDPTNDEF